MSACKIEVMRFGQETQRPWESVPGSTLIEVINACTCHCTKGCECVDFAKSDLANDSQYVITAPPPD